MEIAPGDLAAMSRAYERAEAELERLRLERTPLESRRLEVEERMGQVAMVADGLRAAARGLELWRKPAAPQTVIECDPGLIRGAGK